MFLKLAHSTSDCLPPCPPHSMGDSERWTIMPQVCMTLLFISTIMEYRQILMIDIYTRIKI